jgi:hypothetical protein
MQIVALPQRRLPRRLPDTDVRNPNPRLRDRPLCGLRLGEGFVERDPQYADGGHVYDPRNGRTYKAVMRADGNLLELRGYVGLKLFGRSETWVRVGRTFVPCLKK